MDWSGWTWSGECEERLHNHHAWFDKLTMRELV